MILIQLTGSAGRICAWQALKRADVLYPTQNDLDFCRIGLIEYLGTFTNAALTVLCMPGLLYCRCSDVWMTMVWGSLILKGNGIGIRFYIGFTCEVENTG